MCRTSAGPVSSLTALYRCLKYSRTAHIARHLCLSNLIFCLACRYTPQFRFFFKLELNLMWQACTVVCLSKLNSLSHPRLRKVLCLHLVCIAGQQRESYCFWACKSSFLPSRSKGALLDSWSLLSVLAGLNPQWRSPSSSQRRTFGPVLMSCMLNYLQMLLETYCFYTRKVNSYNSAPSSATKNT